MDYSRQLTSTYSTIFSEYKHTQTHTHTHDLCILNDENRYAWQPIFVFLILCLNLLHSASPAVPPHYTLLSRHVYNTSPMPIGMWLCTCRKSQSFSSSWVHSLWNIFNYSWWLRWSFILGQPLPGGWRFGAQWALRLALLMERCEIDHKLSLPGP